jgi:hypothetical protein
MTMRNRWVHRGVSAWRLDVVSMDCTGPGQVFRDRPHSASAGVLMPAARANMPPSEAYRHAGIYIVPQRNGLPLLCALSFERQHRSGFGSAAHLDSEDANTLEPMPLPVLKKLSCDGCHRMRDCTRVQSTMAGRTSAAHFAGPVSPKTILICVKALAIKA